MKQPYSTATSRIKDIPTGYGIPIEQMTLYFSSEEIDRISAPWDVLEEYLSTHWILPTGELKPTYQGFDLINARAHAMNPIEQLKALLKEI